MKISKEIRIVSLGAYTPEDELSDRLNMIAREKEPISLSLSPNKYDSTCLLAKVRGKDIGVVNRDDKRYVMQLLDHGIAYDCLRFQELHQKDNETPILRYSAWIDLEKVEPIVAGADWATWNYEFPVIEKIAEWNAIDYTAGLLERTLMNHLDDTEYIDELVNNLTSYTRFDISVETTKAYENLSTMLEMNPTEQKREWKNKIQRASTERRSKKTHEQKLPDWWSMCLASSEAKDLRAKFESKVKEDKEITTNKVSDEVLVEVREPLVKNLQKLPYGLYEYIDSMEDFYHKAFYKNIPRKNLVEVISALIIKDWLDKMNEVHEEGGNTYFYIGRDYIHHGDRIESGGTKIQNGSDHQDDSDDETHEDSSAKNKKKK